MRHLLLIGAIAALGTGCSNSEGEFGQNEIFQRMQLQQKYRSYQRNTFFEDQRAMRVPPVGTLSREDYAAGQPYGTGRIPGTENYVENIPVPVDMKLLEKGRKNFDIVCASCHGLVGDGQSLAAVNMALAAPASLHSEKLRGKPDGYIYYVVGHGYGVMPGFDWRFTPEDRWAVVAYVRALQYSQNVPLAEAPADVRTQLMREGQ